MGEIRVINHLTLDGVMQAPGRADEDLRGGFASGGWAQAGNDDVMFGRMAEGMGHGGALLMGRRTYQALAEFWPKQPSNPYTDSLNARQKYVVTETDPLTWVNSTAIRGDVVGEVKRLREQEDLLVMGSGQLIEALLPHGLIDEMLLLIHPIVLGAGRRLFADGQVPHRFRLVDATPTTTGVIMATYRTR